MAVGKTKRFEVFKRDEFTCVYCGRKPPAVTLECDHIVPRASGGGDSLDNLTTACFDCNRGKSDKSLGVMPEPVSVRLNKRREQLEQVEALAEMQMKQRQKTEDAIDILSSHWIHNLVGVPTKRGKTPLNFGWRGDRNRSLRTFLMHLTQAAVLELMEIPFQRFGTPTFEFEGRGRTTRVIICDEKHFSFLCGCCWRTIKQDLPGSWGDS